MSGSNYGVFTDDVAVHVVSPVASPMAIEDMCDVDIASMYESVVTVALMWLKQQRAQKATRVVFVIPSIVEMGAAGHAATCAAAEAVRVLALGAARQWNEHGVTVNCVSAPWPYSSSLHDDIAPIVQFLCSESGGTVSGTTIPVGGPDKGL